MKPQVSSTGAQPCTVCRTFTWSFCETCVMNDKDCPPSPVCKPCEDDGITHPKCKSQGKSREAERIRHLETDKGTMMEVSGVTLELKMEGSTALERCCWFPRLRFRLTKMGDPDSTLDGGDLPIWNWIFPKFPLFFGCRIWCDLGPFATAVV